MFGICILSASSFIGYSSAVEAVTALVAFTVAEESFIADSRPT
jgi:hypothetical protein